MLPISGFTIFFCFYEKQKKKNNDVKEFHIKSTMKSRKSGNSNGMKTVLHQQKERFNHLTDLQIEQELHTPFKFIRMKR